MVLSIIDVLGYNKKVLNNFRLILSRKDVFVAGAILYFVSFIILLISLFTYRKNDKKVNGVSYFVFTFLVVWCYEAVCAGLLNLCNIPISLFGIAICDILATIVVLVCHIKGGKEKQKYYWDYKDFIAIAVIVTVSLLIAYSRYGGWFEIFRFKSGDGSIHLLWAEDVVRTGKIDTMFFQKFRDAITLMFMTPFLGTAYYYRIFLAFQTFLLILSGITFWALIEGELHSLSRKIVGLILTIIYMLGYPLNNMLYGFTYWGTSILLVTLVIYLFREYKKGNIGFNILMLVAFFANAALCVCYVYFAPVVFGAQFLYILSSKREVWKEKISYIFFPLFLAGIFCILYIYFGLFSGIFSSSTHVAQVENNSEVVAEMEEVEIEAKEGGRTITSLWAMDGLSYYDLYSNFVWVIPFVLVYFWNVLHKRKVDEYTLMTILTIGYIGVQFIFCFLDFISVYYYNKNYNLLWLLCFAIMIRVIASTDSSQNQFIVSYGIMCSVLFAGMLIHVDERLIERDKFMCLDERASAYFNLISTNLDTVTDRYNEIKMSPLEQELCNEAIKLVQEGYGVAWISDISRLYDFYAVTNQIPSWSWDLKKEYYMVEQKLVDYALVCGSQYDILDCDVEYLNSQRKVFENTFGYIIEVR